MSAVGMIDWGKPQNNWGAMNDEISKYVKRDLDKASAKSKTAYSNLMGPQFMAKLLENDPAFASLPDADKARVIKTIGGAAAGISGEGDMTSQSNQTQNGGNPVSSMISNFMNSMT